MCSAVVAIVFILTVFINVAHQYEQGEEYSVECKNCGAWREAGSCQYPMGLKGQYLWREVYDREGCSAEHCRDFGCDVSGECKGENVDVDSQCQETCLRRYTSWDKDPYRDRCVQTVRYRQCTHGKCTLTPAPGSGTGSGSGSATADNYDLVATFSCRGCGKWGILGGCHAGGERGILRYRRYGVADAQECYVTACGYTACDTTYSATSDCEGTVKEGQCTEECLQRHRIWYKDNGVCYDRVELRRCGTQCTTTSEYNDVPDELHAGETHSDAGSEDVTASPTPPHLDATQGRGDVTTSLTLARDMGRLFRSDTTVPDYTFSTVTSEEPTETDADEM